MERQQLKYFVEVAKLEHITHAAERLHISQPSVSLAIRRLEEELGVSLFTREGRNIKINAYGRQFFETAVAVLDLLDQGQQKLDKMKYDEESHITISAPPWYIFPNLVEQILAHNPNITISNLDHSYETIMDAFSNHTLDFCITMTTIPNSSLQCVELRDEEMGLITSKSNPLAGRKEIKLADCSQLPFASTVKDNKQYDLLVELCRQAGFTPNIMLEVNNVRDIVRMVEHSTSIVAIIPGHILEALDKNEVPFIHITDVDPHLKLRMYWSKISQEKPTAKWIRHKIIDYFGEMKES